MSGRTAEGATAQVELCESFLFAALDDIERQREARVDVAEIDLASLILHEDEFEGKIPCTRIACQSDQSETNL